MPSGRGSSFPSDIVKGNQNGENSFASQIAGFLGFEFKVLTPSGGGFGLGVNVGGIQL